MVKNAVMQLIIFLLIVGGSYLFNEIRAHKKAPSTSELETSITKAEKSSNVADTSSASDSSNTGNNLGTLGNSDTPSTTVNLSGREAEVTLEEVYTDWRLISPDETYPYLAKVKIKSLGTDIWHSNPVCFTLSSADGDTVSEDDQYTRMEQGVDQKKLDLLDLVQNQSTEGWISFTIKKSKQYTLTYTYENGTIQFPIEMPVVNQQIDIKKGVTQTVTPPRL